MRAVEFIRFSRKVLVKFQLFRRDIQILGRIGEDIEIDRVRWSGGQIDALVIDTALHR